MHERMPNVGAVRGLTRRIQDNLRTRRIVLDMDAGEETVHAPLYLYPTSAAPTSPSEGDVYYDSGLHALLVYNGEYWSSATARTEVITAATDSWTTADHNTTFILSRSGGIDIALPAITADEVGLRYRAIIGAVASSDTYTITAQSGDLLTGRVIAFDTDTANTVVSYAPDGSDDLIITFSDTADLVGSYVDLVATSATSWMVTGVIYHTGNAATPFS